MVFLYFDLLYYRTVIVEESFLPVGVPGQPFSLFSETPAINVSQKGIESPTTSDRAQSCVGNFCLPLKCSTTEEPYMIQTSNFGLTLLRSNKMVRYVIICKEDCRKESENK